MKHVIYFCNNVQGEEEIHEDEETYKLRLGETIKREGAHWKIVKTDLQTVNELKPLDILRVYLEPNVR